MRSTASRSCAPQSHRWLPNTSPVRHSLWARISGTARCRSPAWRGAARSPSAKARCSPSSTSPSKLNTWAPVAYPSANRRGSATCVRIVALGGLSATSPVPEARGEGVPQEHDVADLPNVDERRPAAGVPREAAVAHEPGSLGVADEHRRDGELQLVHDVLGEELRVHRRAALDHQPFDAPLREV